MVTAFDTHSLAGCFLKGGSGGALKPNINLVSGTNDMGVSVVDAPQLTPAEVPPAVEVPEVPAAEVLPATQVPEVPPATEVPPAVQIPPPPPPFTPITLPRNINPGMPRLLSARPCPTPSPQPTPLTQQPSSECNSLSTAALYWERRSPVSQMCCGVVSTHQPPPRPLPMDKPLAVVPTVVWTTPQPCPPLTTPSIGPDRSTCRYGIAVDGCRNSSAQYLLTMSAHAVAILYNYHR